MAWPGPLTSPPRGPKTGPHHWGMGNKKVRASLWRIDSPPFSCAVLLPGESGALVASCSRPGTSGRGGQRQGRLRQSRHCVQSDHPRLCLSANEASCFRQASGAAPNLFLPSPRGHDPCRAGTHQLRRARVPTHPLRCRVCIASGVGWEPAQLRYGCSCGISAMGFLQMMAIASAFRISLVGGIEKRGMGWQQQGRVDKEGRGRFPGHSLTAMT